MGIQLHNDRLEEIKRIVTDMYVRYEISCVPISGFEIANKMGICVIPYSAISVTKRYLLLMKSEDGFSVEKNEGEWYIL